MTPPATVGVFSGGETYGDAIYKIVFLRALRRAFPGARITWLTAENTLYARSLKEAAGPPLLDEVRERCGVGERPGSILKSIPSDLGRFDLLLDTQSVLWRTYAVQRIPHDRFVSAAFMRYRLDKRTHILDRLLALLERATGTPSRRDLSPLPVPPDLRRAAHAALPGEATRHVGLAPGAGGAEKVWPLDRFLDLAEGIAAAGRTPVFLLGPAEAGLRDPIAARLPAALFPLDHPAWAPVGGPSPLGTVAVAARLAAAVANDSGTGHMIAAAGTPLVSLFGPSDPAKFRPLTPRGVVVRAVDHGGPAMDRIPVEAARGALDALLSGTWRG